MKNKNANISTIESVKQIVIKHKKDRSAKALFRFVSRTDIATAIIKVLEQDLNNCKVKIHYGRARYNPLNHTALCNNMGGLIAEMAHCKQVADKGKMHFIGFFVRSFFMKPFYNNKTYRAQYQTKGTLEWQAHQEIETEIVALIKSHIKMYSDGKHGSST